MTWMHDLRSKAMSEAKDAILERYEAAIDIFAALDAFVSELRVAGRISVIDQLDVKLAMTKAMTALNRARQLMTNLEKNRIKISMQCSTALRHLDQAVNKLRSVMRDDADSEPEVMN